MQVRFIFGLTVGLFVGFVHDTLFETVLEIIDHVQLMVCVPVDLFADIIVEIYLQ